MGIDKQQPNEENDLTALEHRLARWRPAAGRLDRDRMLFDAGHASARPDATGRLWQFATAMLVFITAGLGGLLAHEQSQRLALETQMAARSDPAEPKTSVPTLVQLATNEPPGPNSYLTLTLQLAKGIRDLSSPDAGFEFRPTQPARTAPASSPFSEPLRPGDLQRVLDL